MAKIIDNYDVKTLREMVLKSESMPELLLKLGYTSAHGTSYRIVRKKLDDLCIDYSHFSLHKFTHRTPENTFIYNSKAKQSTVRRLYLRGNYTPYRCAICGLGPEWKGKPLTLTLDHINGISNDDRLENLRWVCPNCDRQLETFSVGAKRVHKKKKKFLEEKQHSENNCKFESIDKEQFVLDYYKMSTKELAEKYKIAKSTVREWIIKLDIKTKTEIKNDAIYELNCLSREALIEKLSVYGSKYKFAKEMNIPVNHVSEALNRYGIKEYEYSKHIAFRSSYSTPILAKLVKDGTILYFDNIAPAIEYVKRKNKYKENLISGKIRNSIKTGKTRYGAKWSFADP